MAAVEKIDSIVICEPSLADRDQIVAMLLEFYRTRELPELTPYLFDTGDAASRLDYCIERQLGALAKIGDRVVGLCGWRLTHGAPVLGEPVGAEMVVLYVHADARRNGIAEKLCRRFLQVCRDSGISKPRLALQTTPESEALLLKLGFSERLRVYETRIT